MSLGISGDFFGYRRSPLPRWAKTDISNCAQILSRSHAEMLNLGRGARIRTGDLLRPRQALTQQLVDSSSCSLRLTSRFSTLFWRFCSQVAPSCALPRGVPHAAVAPGSKRSQPAPARIPIRSFTVSGSAIRSGSVNRRSHAPSRSLSR